MDDNLRSLKRKADPDVVEMARELLAQAEAGEVVGIALIVDFGNAIQARVSGRQRRAEQLFAFEIWKRDFLFKPNGE